MTTRIARNEYLTDVQSTTGYGQTIYQINPANRLLFPWLSQIAANYEEYWFQSLCFSYVSKSADSLNSTNTALGSVIMCTQYDPNDPDFTGKFEIQNYVGTTGSKPSQSQIHVVNCALQTNWLDVRPDNTTGDLRLYNIGKFYFATYGMQAAATIGDLWVSYDIVLQKPKLYDTLGYADSTTIFSVSGTSGLLPFGNTGATVNKNPIDVGISSGTTLIFKPQTPKYMRIVCRWIGSAPVVITLPTPTGSNMAINTIRPLIDGGVSSAQAGALYDVTISDQSIGSQFILSTGGTLPSASSSVQVWIFFTSP